MRDVQRLYLDTEFLAKGYTLELVSIAVVPEEPDLVPFYAESFDFAWSPDDHAQRDRANLRWLEDNVRPALWSTTDHDERRWRSQRAQVRGGWMTNRAIAASLYEYVESVRRGVDDRRPVEFWTYYGAYDWVLLSFLYGGMLSMPKSWPMQDRDLREVLADMCGIPTPEAMGYTEHHALDDARWNRDVHRWAETKHPSEEQR